VAILAVAKGRGLFHVVPIPAWLAIPVVVLIFEVVLNTISMFYHGNGRRPRLEHSLRPFVVTPDMDRVRHSVDREEIGSNFGFKVPR
jgi:sterol desaturase/sphingolipid hydroxylase (fatty acid hydroxylase superfamily)